MTVHKTGVRIVCDGGGCLQVADYEICGLSTPLRLCKDCAQKLKRALDAAFTKNHSAGEKHESANKKR